MDRFILFGVCPVSRFWVRVDSFRNVWQLDDALSSRARDLERYRVLGPDGFEREYSRGPDGRLDMVRA